MAKVDLVVFDERQLPKILTSFGIQQVVSKSDLRTYLKNPDGSPIKCECCEKVLDINNVGNIMKGSKKLYCKNPSCYSSYLIKKKL